MTLPPSGIAVEAVPASAGEIFADQLPLARRYAHLLATVGVERGLIGPREAPRLWQRHLLNSAALAPHVPASAVTLDLGSGAGLPGIPLKLARPDVSVSLVEPMRRRATFLVEVVTALGLDVAVLPVRAESLAPAQADVVVARAVAPLRRLIPIALPLLRRGGRLLALKGTNAAADMADAHASLQRWPTARAQLIRAAAGETETVVVMIALDDAPSDSGGSLR